MAAEASREILNYVYYDMWLIFYTNYILIQHVIGYEYEYM